MTNEELLKNLNKYNEDEIFYRDYYNARKDSKKLEAFLKNLDRKDAINRRLIIPDMPGTFMPKMLGDDAFFDTQKSDNIVISKHNRYTPKFVHNHAFFECSYVIKGSAKQSVGGVEIDLVKGQFCMVSPGVKHSVSVFDDSLLINILIRRATFEQIFYSLLFDNNAFSTFFNSSLSGKGGGGYIIANSGDDAFIKNQVLFMFGEYIEKNKYYENILDNCLIMLFSMLSRKYEDTFHISDTLGKAALITDVLAYIYENWQTVTLNDLSLQFHYSPEHLSRLIRDNTGKSFSGIVKQTRLNRACYLLENTNDSIIDIAHISGYPHAEHFNRTFKETYNMTPGAYRKKHRENEI